MQQILETRFGYAPEHIRTLRDAEATRLGILEALERLATDAAPEDAVYVHFSGHGSQAPDMDGDEVDDELDETLVPHDGRTADVRDITDDELANALAGLRARSTLVVLDSCHSGSATRAPLAIQPRWVPRDERVSLYEGGRTQTRAIVPLERRHLLLSAAAPHEQALDGAIDGRPQGIFTYALSRSLAKVGPEGSARDVFQGIERELERLKPQLGMRDMPEPQLEGPPDQFDAALLSAPTEAPGAADDARLPWVGVQPGGAPGEVVLTGAVVLGAVPGATWAIYPPEEREFEPGRALAAALVKSVARRDAIASLDPTDTAVPESARAVAVSPPRAPGRVAVLWLETPETRRARLEARIRESLREVDFVGEGEFARFVVACPGETCRVYGADGRSLLATLAAEDEVALAANLAGIFGRSLTAAELLALDNPAAKLDLQVGIAGDAEPGAAGRAVGRTLAPVYRIRRSGDARSDENSLQLRIRASEDCYLSVVDVDSQGRVQMLFPNEISEARGYLPEGRIAAGETALVPDSLGPANRAGFYLDYSPPAGTDTIRAFCTRDRGVSHGLREYVAQAASPPTRAAERAGEERRDAAARLGALQGALARLTTRGIAIVADAPEPLGSPSPLPQPTPVGAAAAQGLVSEAPPGASTALADWSAASLTVDVIDAAAAATGIQLTYVDSDRFDAELAASMARGPASIQVAFVAAVTPNALPERINQWLYAVSERYGGRVELRPDPAHGERAGAGELVPLVLQAYQTIRTRLLYRHAKHYDAFLYFEPDGGQLTRMVFERRSS
jgi:hypothetical protein